MEDFDLVVAGAGAAGLMAACQAPAGTRVALCDPLPEAGRKLLATGGGRCNFTTARDPADLPALFGPSGRFVVPALRAMPPARIRKVFAGLGVPSVVEDGRYVFPASRRASDVRDALLRAALRRGTAFFPGTRAEGLWTEGGAVRGVRTTRGLLRAPRVLLATGGRSMPALGSDGSGHALARAAGHEVTPLFPALVPLTVADDWAKALPGLSLEEASLRLEIVRPSPASRRRGPREEAGAVLFTHHGLSGPAALDLSGAVAAALADGPVRVVLRPVAGLDATAWRAILDGWRATDGGRSPRNLLATRLPRAFATALCDLAGLANQPLAQTPKAALLRLAELCGGVPLVATGTGGWEHSMVTRGGVALSGVDPATLQSRHVAGLFFAGEILDLDAPCGGFNLTWAFASATLAVTAGMGAPPKYA